MGEVGEIAKQFRLTAMVEFVRASSFISTLPTLLKIARARRRIRICVRCWTAITSGRG